MAKSASNPRIPVWVRFIPRAFDPPCPPITAIAPALLAALRKSPKIANKTSPLFLGSPFMTTSTIFLESCEVCLTSSSILKRFTATTSPSAPAAGVEPVQPNASTCKGFRIGSSNSPCAVPRVHPRQSWYFSLCTFSRPMAFIFPAPQSCAFRSDGVPVTRAPMSSLSSVRYWNACESIIPSPAIFTSAGFVPSSSGPFGAGRLSARAVHAPPKQTPGATTQASKRRIRFLLAPFTRTNSITLSDAPAAIRFLQFFSALLCVRRLPRPGLGVSALYFLLSSCRFTTLSLSFDAWVHLRQLPCIPLFTHFPPHPTLPRRPSCVFISPFARSCTHSQYLFCLPLLFLPPRQPSKLPKSHPRNPPPSPRLLPRNQKTPIRSSFSKLATASKPTATAGRKSTLASISTMSSASANSPASISITTVPSNPSKSLSSISPIPAAARLTSSPALLPTIPILPLSTPPLIRMSASHPSASSASRLATSSNTASSPRPPTTLSPRTFGSTIPSTAPASSLKRSSSSIFPLPVKSKFALTRLLRPNLRKSPHLTAHNGRYTTGI